MALDPVCGMEVAPETAAASSRADGQTFYFCSEDCRQRFESSRAGAGLPRASGAPQPVEMLGAAPPRRNQASSPGGGPGEAPPGREIISLRITGMHCASCVARVEKALLAVPGVSRAAVNLTTRTASVSVDSSVSSGEDIAAAVRAAGYEASVERGDLSLPGGEDAQEAGSLRARLRLAAALTLPVFVLEMFFMDWTPGRWLSLMLSAPVVFGAGLEFHRGALASVRRRSADMNTLIAVGTSAAYLYSVLSGLSRHSSTAPPSFWPGRSAATRTPPTPTSRPRPSSPPSSCWGGRWRRRRGGGPRKPCAR